ncbi:hypothetical protein ACLB2K_012667 [Fragaria x ananassa]
MSSNVLNFLLPCLRKEGEDADRSFLDNGSKLLEDLIASCDGKCNPIRHYSAQELIRATNNFDPSGMIPEGSFYYRGFLDNRLIIIKKRGGKDGLYRNFKRARLEAIRDIVISMQMSTHKNVLKLLGCCLEFPIPALVHEYATQGCVLNDKGGCRSNHESLPWNTRLRIAKQLASAVSYLHTAFPRPIIHRHLRPHCIFLDDDFVPKLCDFSYSITIPPEKSHVEDVVIKGTMWYLSPEFLDSGFISEKFDVYSFGVILLVFLAGRKPLEGHEDLVKSVKFHASDGHIQTIVDPKILEELGGEDEPTQRQLRDFLALAWLCTQDESELRPDMTDVAKELMRIETRSLHPCLTEKEAFLQNGSKLLEDLIASCDGKALPIRHYSAQELIRATNNFDHNLVRWDDGEYRAFRGFLENRSVIIKKMENIDKAIRDIIISMQMSTHKNVLKLLGCCLEFPVPALVHEYVANGVLSRRGGYGDNESLPWKTRLCIAKQVANAITYLHTAFPRPIIHRDLKPNCIFLDNDFAPKLCNFSLSVTIPPEQSHVEDKVLGTFGFLDPDYYISNQITEKTDVYSFGVILLILLTGKSAIFRDEAEERQCLVSYVNLHACDGQFQTIVDPKILGELGGGDEEAQLQQLHDFLTLALLCTRKEIAVRPDMIDVAKELVRIEKSVIPC